MKTRRFTRINPTEVIKIIFVAIYPAKNYFVRMDLPSLANKTRAGFTLIELLIVIAIMAVLAAISVPAVNKALASSRSSKCLSNLKQLGTAILTYPIDNNGYLPRGNNNIDPSTGKNGYEYNKAIYNYIPTLNNKITGKQVNKIFLCPAEKQPTDYSTTCTQYTASFTLEAGSSSTTATGVDGNGPRTLASVEKPSEAILLVDGKIGGNSYIYSSDSASPWSQVDEDINLADSIKTVKVSFRHSSAMNAVYADGHVGTITWADRKDTNKLSETIWRGRTP